MGLKEFDGLFGCAPVLGLCLALLGCKDLPEIARGECGNHVLEPPEDCDGFARDGSPCRPPGSLAECRLDCSPDAMGALGECPAGWGCTADRVCRPATGGFQLLGQEIPGNAAKVLAGDFDADGKQDIVGVEAALGFGVTRLRVHYFGDDAEPLETWTSDKLFASPVVTDVSDDGRADIVYSYGSMGVLVGETNRSLLPEAYPSYFLGPSEARTIVVHDEPVEDSAAFVVLAERDGVNGIFVADFASAALRRLAEVPGRVEDLAAEPVVGRLFDDEASFPCNDFALAYQDSTEVSVYTACERNADNSLAWRAEPRVTTVALEPPAVIDRGLVLADFDGDGHLDLLVGTVEGPYLARGDGRGIGSALPHPFVLKIPDVASAGGEPQEVLVGMPVAAGDLSNDGIADLVLPRGLAISERDPDSGRITYLSSHEKFGAPWTEALFADFNANGMLDVACASNAGLGIDFFNGTGNARTNPFVIPTARPVEHLTVGDFDGDLVNDLGFVQLKSVFEDEEEISIAFGRIMGHPDPPRAVAHLDDVRQISGFVSDSVAALANLVIIFEQKNAEGNAERALGFLVGSGDRSLPSFIELTTFAEDASLQGSTSVAVTVGAFVHAGQVDAMPLGFRRGTTATEFGMWLLEDIPARNHPPRSIGWGFDSETTPLGGPLGDTELSVRLSSGDLDGDEIDELVLIAPDKGGARCVVNVARVSSAADPELFDQRAVILDSPCYESQLDVTDLDGDGAPELVLLAGERSERSLMVLWNDGSGGFDENDSSSIATHGESPQAFTHFPAPDSSTMLAYVTGTGVRLLRARGHERAFDDEGIVGGLGQGTGIVAADVDGDRVVDLVVADSGSVRVLRAGLVP